MLAHGLRYPAGVLASMAALAAVVVALRAAGTAVGWGFQFQEPLFVAALASVLVIFALNLFGVFEIGVDTGRLAALGSEAAGSRRSFFDGLLAVVLATPCSAPFLGTAVGFAFASPPLVIGAIFLAIGVGLAAALRGGRGSSPDWARWLPRVGALDAEAAGGARLRLLATVVWLLWIVGRSAGADAMASLLACLLALGFATWLFGGAAQELGLLAARGAVRWRSCSCWSRGRASSTVGAGCAASRDADPRVPIRPRRSRTSGAPAVRSSCTSPPTGASPAR